MFTSTPTEDRIRHELSDWLAAIQAGVPVRACSLRDTSVVVLHAFATQVSTSEWPQILQLIGTLRSAIVARNKTAPKFLVMSRPDVSPPRSGWKNAPDPRGVHAKAELAAQHQHEHELARLIAPIAGVELLPVSVGTTDGVRVGLIQHQRGSSHHFTDSGRWYLAQTLLNVLSLMIEPRSPARAAAPSIGRRC